MNKTIADIMRDLRVLGKRYFEGLLYNQTLSAIYPEIYALVGVPQPVKWHPEGDAYDHTMMVFQMAINLYPDDPMVAIGALVHDMGKALTPSDILPSHHGHAIRGIRPTASFMHRLGFAADSIDTKMAALLTKYHMHVHDAFKMNPKTYGKIYTDVFLTFDGDVGLTSQFFVTLGRLGVCDHYGRGGVDESAFPSYDNAWWFMCLMINAQTSPYPYDKDNVDQNRILRHYIDLFKQIHKDYPAGDFQF